MARRPLYTAPEDMMSDVIRLSDAAALVPTRLFPHATFPFANFNVVQSALYTVYEQDANVTVAASTSSGKAQPLTSPVLTPRGFVPMGTLREGGQVIGSDGLPHTVLAIFPQGEKEVFRVSFGDGTSTLCCAEHLWSVRTRSQKRQGKGFAPKSLQDLMGDLSLPDGHTKWYIPVITIADFEPLPGEKLPLDPFLLGFLLGDGGIAHNVRFSTDNFQSVQSLVAVLPDKSQVRYAGKYDFCISGGMEGHPDRVVGMARYRNRVKWELRRMGLFGLRSHEKFIPVEYLHASPHSRLRLLRGLMDTDGTPNPGRGAEFSSSSIRLVQGVCDLVRSLGGVTKIRIKDKVFYTYKGKKRRGKTAYRVTVNLGTINPFALEWKAQAFNTEMKKGRTKRIVKVEHAGREECQCIMVDSHDHLYVTDGYTLTHNTVCAEMMLAQEIRERGGKGMYISPLKALAQEKIDDWTEPGHHFADQRISICTGDYVLTEARKKELQEANLILMTSEMLASRTRNARSEKNTWIKEVGTLVVDESHLITVPGRGDHLEVALMKLCAINPRVRIVFLSATLPNVDQLCGWLSKLTGRRTYLLESAYRPCPLNIHFEMYDKVRGDYEENEASKVWAAEQIIDAYPQDKFLVFAHTKRTGEIARRRFEEKGIQCDFHNADLPKERRCDLERRFKNDRDFRVIVATSTLAWGLNLPARRVIILGVHRGLGLVPTYDLNQECGRAGRPAYDPAGDAYVLLPDEKREYANLKEHCQTPTLIQSQLLAYVGNQEDGVRHYKVLAFHVVSEIHRGGIRTRKDFHKWYRRSLANYQAHDLDAVIIGDVLELLVGCGAVKEDPETHQLTAAPVGTIASMLYFSPFDVSDFKRNFGQLFAKKQDHLDHAVAMALGNIDSFRFGICSKAEREEIGPFAKALAPIFGTKAFLEPAVKAGYCYHALLQGKHNPVLNGMMKALQYDFDRTTQVLTMIDQMASKWGRRGWLLGIKERIRYGVKPHLIGLCGLPEVGAVRKQRLYDAGFRTASDLASDPQGAALALKIKGERLANILRCASQVDVREIEGPS